ncbi:asparagine synthase (glutamine-hydrolyzing) [Arenimonas sp.]|uniref:asparagine synthase (glutamine-hydrolyzing) n=1 Tax=Arenimonas sp. TaxID=1872635 RepID=UPI002E30347C|nr:asparagine synthase (glutamine-hydrolyzing) [Arenimonas sp.]HEX4853465.1 asparagine synthase (glutamine-hydrolyzing) [Arenimonas sp.]
MCGIAGLLGSGASGAAELLLAMGEALRHRGPDGAGVWTDGCTIGLVHRRLSILELTEAGHQPMHSRDARWTLSFNGEIYNHALLKRELEAIRQRSWRGRSDTEVLVEAIAEFGVEGALQRCEGMFALAVWDARLQVLHLARDRFGEKPLYVGWIGGDIVFGSELRALREHPGWRHAVEPRALDWYFRVGYVPAPWSIHPGVYKVPAATLISLGPGDTGAAPGVGGFRSRLRRYWSVEEAVSASLSDPWEGSYSEAMEAVQGVLDASVRSKMLADVPIGALLSGGIDSTLVVASMARQSVGQVKTFTVGFEVGASDESEPASQTASYWGTDHQTVLLPADSALNMVDRLADVYDEPFADAAQLPAILVSQALNGKVKVALTGDGGDELFQGYQRYLDADRNWRMLRLVPASLRPSLAAAVRAVSGISIRGAFAERMLRQSERIGARDLESYGLSLMTFVGASAGFSPDGNAWPGIPKVLSNTSPGPCLRWLDQSFSLPEGINTKLDRASMSTGIELRAPYLDVPLFSLAWRLPESWLATGGVGKCILRSLARTQAPPQISTLRKQGFDVPIAEWLRGPLRDWASDLLSIPALKEDPFLDPTRIRRMLEDHLARRADHAHALWAVLVYRVWAVRHG